MGKMSEIDMMVQDAVDLVEENGDYLTVAMEVVAIKWALDSEEFAMVYRIVNARVYP